MTLFLCIAFFVLIAINVPVSFAFGIATLAAIVAHPTLPLNSLVTRMFVGVDSFTLLAVPFFILAGELMNASGITTRIVDFSRTLVGHIRGGLAHVNIISNMLFSGISGSATADASALGAIMIPAMIRNGFHKDYAVAVNAAASSMGPIIPPSIMLVIYGSIANVSIAELFLGGIIPGLLIAVALLAVAYIIAVRRGYPAERRAKLTEVIQAGRSALIALLMPLIILGGMFTGAFTATEAGAVAVAYALIVGLFVYRTIKPAELVRIFVDASVMTAAAMLVIAMSTGFAWLLAWDGFAGAIMDGLLSISTNPIVVLILIIIALQIVGLFVDGIPVLVIMTPVLLPVILNLGLDPVHFGIIIVMSTVIGSVTPPVGVLIFIGCSIARATLSEVFWVLWPFCLGLFAVLLAVAFYPPLVLAIPQFFR